MSNDESGANDVIVPAGPPDREWQCIECGHVVETKTRPDKCPDCNCVNSDFEPGVKLFAPRDVVGWFE